MWLISTIIAKITHYFIKSFKKSSGYTWPGHIVLKIFPHILSKVDFPKGIILISGTNGKTTTSKLITHLLSSQRIKVTHNKTGANLLNGLLSSILLDTSAFGKINGDIGVFEVDEFVLPEVLKHISPTVLILLNLSRDQLDRYGETDIIFEKWKEAVSKLPSFTSLVLYEDQKEFQLLPSSFAGKVLFFDANKDLLKKTSLSGDFNAKNINASLLALKQLGFNQSVLEDSLSGFTAAYGRGETLEYKEKSFSIFLAKNPASFNHNLDSISEAQINADSLIFILNDNIPDGRDVSWIYDIDPLKLKKACEVKSIYVTGTRRFDMAVRLEYANVKVEKDKIVEDIKSILEIVTCKNSIVLPNYSAMLQFRETVLGRKIL